MSLSVSLQTPFLFTLSCLYTDKHHNPHRPDTRRPLKRVFISPSQALPISGVITSSRFVSSRVTVPLLAARKLLSIEYKIDITPAEAPVGRTYSDDHRHSTFFVRVYNCVKRHLLSPVGLSRRSGSSVTSVTKRRLLGFHRYGAGPEPASRRIEEDLLQCL